MTAPYDVPYMLRTRDYYRAQGYDTDYQWPHFESTPFTRPTQDLQVSTVAVITTAMPDTAQGRSRRQLYSLPSTPVPTAMYTAELSWDKKATHTDDVGSFLPLTQLHESAANGAIGKLAPSFHCLPTDYSQRNTLEKDAPQILQRCVEDQVDIALLVPL